MVVDGSGNAKRLLIHLLNPLKLVHIRLFAVLISEIVEN